jgi:hypothetical protein
MLAGSEDDKVELISVIEFVARQSRGRPAAMNDAPDA